MEDANDDQLVLISYGVVLEVNRSGKEYYNTMRDIVEITYISILHKHVCEYYIFNDSFLLLYVFLITSMVGLMDHCFGSASCSLHMI